MALIKCKECGHEVSDKASACPNCGCPVEKGLVCKECGNILNPNDRICSNCGNPIKGNVVGEDKPIARYILFSLIIALLLGGVFFAYTLFCKSENYTVVGAVSSDTIRSDANLSEQVDKNDSSSYENEQIVPLNKSAKEDICKTYLETLHNLGVSDDMSYFLFDITNDGIPDLWVKEGETAIFDITVFSYQDGKINVIYKETESHSTFYAGSNYVLLWWGHMGNQAWIKLTYDGKTINSSVIFEGVVIDDENDWKEPKEKEIEFYQAYNELPIKRAFGME